MALTKRETHERGRRPSNDMTPPEGGWGWMVVVACFLTTICTRAVTRCVSIFFVEFQLHFQKDYSSTAWIHSLTDSTTMLCAPLGGLLGNHMSCRATVMLGGLLSSAGLILSSFAPSIEFLYIFMGILTGLGFALSYTPSIAMVGTYFDERKALAYGIALSGSGIGTFILAPVVQLLIEHYSWRGALLILGGFVANLCVCGALMRPLEPSGDERLEESNVPKEESDGVKAVKEALDSKDTEQHLSDCSGVEMEINKLNCTQGLIANEVLKNCEVDSYRFFVSRRSDTTFRNIKCFLFHNKLTANSGTLKQSGHELVNGSTVEGLDLNKKLADIMDTRDSRFTYTKSSEVPLLDKNTDADPKPSCSSRGCCTASREEFGFLFVPNFLILSLSVLFMAYGCSSSVVYLVPYALSTEVEEKQAAFLMSIFGVCGIVGNITFGWFTDRKCLKRYRTLCYMIAVGMDGLCCMFIPFLHSFPLLALASVFYGYFDGAYVALIPVVTSEVLNSTYLTSALGVVYFLHGIPYLVSPPIGGWLVDRTGNYTATFLLSGASFIFSSVILAAAMLVRRFSKSRSKLAAASCPDSAQHGVI